MCAAIDIFLHAYTYVLYCIIILYLYYTDHDARKTIPFCVYISNVIRLNIIKYIEITTFSYGFCVPTVTIGTYVTNEHACIYKNKMCYINIGK